MLYDLTLKITYTYDVPASGSRHVMRLLPATIPGRQRLIAGTVQTTPKPDERTDSVDFFSNLATSVLFRAPHEMLDIVMKARVEVDALPVAADLSPELSKLPGECDTVWDMGARSPHHFLAASPRLPEERDIAHYARQSFAPGRTVRAIAADLCSRIHADFRYDGDATTVDSTPLEAFRLKKGVCQDFSHIMIVGLRSLGIPSAYVSGFLRTLPPAGKERLEGADAMHAWVTVWCGRTAGWVEYDPTNNMLAGADHIVVGYGRDYADVAPVIGVLKIYGNQKTEQAVDVIPVA
jgi:transglutaminase-like putative cysteine protease